MVCLGPVNIQGHELIPSCIHFLDDPHVPQGILLLLGQGVYPLPVVCQMKFQLVPALAHKLIGKAVGPDAEKSRIVSQWVEHLAVSHPPGHHHIGCRLGLGEHVLDFQAGLDIPFRHIVLTHLCHPLVLQPLALSHTLHDGEGKPFLQPHLNQIDHNIIPAADGCLDGGLAA